MVGYISVSQKILMSTGYIKKTKIIFVYLFCSFQLIPLGKTIGGFGPNVLFVNTSKEKEQLLSDQREAVFVFVETMFSAGESMAYTVSFIKTMAFTFVFNSR